MVHDPVQGSSEGERATNNDEPTTRDFPLDRRSYLKAASGVAATLAATATASSVSASEEYDRVLDAVSDLGCDQNGDRPIQDTINDALASNTRIDFPDGQYLIDGQILVHGMDNVGLFGAEDAEFVVGDFYGDIIHVRDSTGFRLDGLEINQEVTNNAGNINVIADDWEISNVTVYGDERNPQSGGDGGHKFNVHVESSNSIGRVRDCKVLDYTDLDRYRDVTGGIRAGPSHYGTLYVENTYVEGRGNNSSYASRTNGPVIFKNCHHKNSNGAQFRIGHPDSRVENCVASLDEREVPDWVDVASIGNWRGLRAESDSRFDHGHAGLQFIDTDIVVEYVDEFPVHSGIQIQKRWGGATIDGCRIQMNADANTITMNDVDWDEVSSDDTAVSVLNTHITGDASGRNSIYVGTGRDGTTVENCCIYQPESGQTGVSADSDVTVSDTTINVGGSTTSGSVSTSGISTDGTCDVPELGGSEETPEDAFLLSFVTEPDATYAEYAFTAAGEIEGTTDPEPSPSGKEVKATGVEITEDGDEWTAEGLSGGGYGDAYYVYGPVTEIWLEQPDVMWVELDGERMEPEEVIEKTGGADDESDEDGTDEDPDDGTDDDTSDDDTDDDTSDDSEETSDDTDDDSEETSDDDTDDGSQDTTDEDEDDTDSCEENSYGFRVCSLEDWDSFIALLR